MPPCPIQVGRHGRVALPSWLPHPPPARSVGLTLVTLSSLLQQPLLRRPTRRVSSLRLALPQLLLRCRLSVVLGGLWPVGLAKLGRYGLQALPPWRPPLRRLWLVRLPVLSLFQVLLRYSVGVHPGGSLPSCPAELGRHRRELRCLLQRLEQRERRLRRRRLVTTGSGGSAALSVGSASPLPITGLPTGGRPIPTCPSPWVGFALR